MAETLSLDEEGVVEIPLERLNLDSLKRVSAYKNLIETFPNELLRFKDLERLNLSVNKLKALPEEVGGS
ncbi:MAG: hypothetical protein KDK62_00860 [Chlamydiia bacterium]|nr:hypothetical protein [Chlamydiia bacterium]